MKFKILENFLEENGIALSDNQIFQLEKLADFLIAENKTTNLTAITSPIEIEIKHMADSLAAVNLIKKLSPSFNMCRTNLVDVGCGAGFPGLPLAAALPETDITLLDSLGKKISFVNDAISELRLNNAFAVCARAEDFARGTSSDNNLKAEPPGGKTVYPGRERFNLAVSRAVAKIRVLLELCLPLIEIGGYCVFYKSADFQKELSDAESAMEILGGEFLFAQTYTLPEGCGQRNLIVIRKTMETPGKYPRRAGMPEKRPL